MSKTKKVAIVSIVFLLSIGICKSKAQKGKQPYTAYLFAYFTGNNKTEEAIHLAVSKDAYHYIALNDDKPIILSDTISETGGIRDPHILRGADGKTFYMVATDMVSAKGWNSNRAMVLLKSTDLVHWSHAVVNIQKKFAGQEKLERVWAPQTIYNRQAKKYMIYWAMKYADGIDKIYYAYANKAFTDLEDEPKQLFVSTDNKSCIDADIIESDGKFHLFFKTEGNGNGIKQAISNELTSGYVQQDEYLQQTNVPVEGSCVFKLNTKKGFVLMYDMYGSGKYQFTYSEDLKHFKVIDEEVTMNFHPRHGTVISITNEEAKRLSSKWLTPQSVITTPKSSFIKKNNSVFDKDTIFGQLIHAQIKGQKDFHSWAPTPPMGWNSWDCYGPNVTEAEVKANADYMAQNLKQYGWNYIVVDIRWYVANDKSHGYNETDPQYSMDSFGRFIPAVNRFPSSAGGKGFKPLADYLHSKGLKLGIHIMRGVPVIAVKNKMRVYGTDKTAADIFSDSVQCPWLHDMYTVLSTKTGSQEYYNSIISLYAAWGVDFIKCDDLSRPYHKAEIEMLRKAIDKCGRKMVLSFSPGETPITEGKHVQAHANMWRTIDDFWDNWPELKAHFDIFSRWNKYRIDGAYPDGDMLPLGHLGIKAERGNDRMTLFSKDEQYTLITLWCIFKSPLMFGGDLPGNDSFTLSLLTNKEVLYILNHSINNKQVFNEHNKVVWVADDPASGDKYIAFFNTADTAQTISLSVLKEIGIKGNYTTRDLWVGKKEKGTAQLLSVAVNPHGTVLYKVSKQK